METEGPMYDKLPTAARILQKDLQLAELDNSSEKKYLNAFLEANLPASDAQKIQEKMTFYVQTLEKSSDIKLKKLKKKPLRKKGLSCKEKKQLKLFTMAPDEKKFANFKPLYELWIEYMRDLLQTHRASARNEAELEQKLLRADYHGCLAVVGGARSASLLGQSGIIIQETKNTWKIITTKDKVKLLPKDSVVLTCMIDDFCFSVFSPNLKYKPADRAKRKFAGYYKVDPGFLVKPAGLS